MNHVPKIISGEFNIYHYGISILIFLIYILSLIGWGQLVAKFFKNYNERDHWIDSTVIHLGLGQLFFISTAMLLGHLSYLGSRYAPIFIFILAIGVVYSIYHFLSDLSKDKIPLKLRPKYLLFLPLFYYVFINSLRMNQIIDVYLYHLSAPKIWWETGAITLISHHPIAFQASWWEYLYLWIMPFLKGNDFDLIYLQLVAQLLHFSLGFAASFLVLLKLIRQNIRSKYVAISIALLTLASYSLFWTSWFAKNDYGVCFWILSSLYYWRYSGQKSASKSFILVGLFLGIAISAKWTLAFTGLPFLVILLKDAKKQWVYWSTGLLLGVTPILLRNFYFTLNPFFPTYNQLFSNEFLPLSQELKLQFLSRGRPEFGILLRFFLIQVKENLLLVFSFFPWFLICDNKKTKTISAQFYFIFIASFTIYFLMTGPMILYSVQLRLLNVGLILGQISFLIPLSNYLFKLMKYQKKYILSYSILLISCLYIRPYINWSEIFLKFDLYRPDKVVNRFMSAAECKGWLYEHAKRTKILSMADEDKYFLWQEGHSISYHNPVIDRKLLLLQDPREMVNFLKSKNIGYLYFKYDQPNINFFKYIPVLQHYLKKSDFIKFKGKDCFVVDLKNM